MDQWRSKFSDSLGLDWNWAIECSSLLLSPGKVAARNVTKNCRPIPQATKQILSRETLPCPIYWTTGVPSSGDAWRKFHVVPRLYPLFSTLFNKGGNRRAL